MFYYVVLSATIVVLMVQRLFGGHIPRIFQIQATETKVDPNQDSADHIEKLVKFDFTKEPPRPYRPFKNCAHVAMGMYTSFL